MEMTPASPRTWQTVSTATTACSLYIVPDVLMHVRILQTINVKKKHYVFKPAEQFHMP